MPRDGAITFSDLIGKLDTLEVACDKCGRKGRYALARLIEQRGREHCSKLARNASVANRSDQNKENIKQRCLTLLRH